MKLTVYGYAKCGTCRKAVRWLQEQGHELKEIPIFDKPPSVKELEKLAKRSGLETRKFFNTSGEVYKEMGLKDKLPAMSEDEMLKLLASNGRLIKRPVVTDGKRVTVGYHEARYAEVWGGN